jgi:hypothetical protein
MKEKCDRTLCAKNIFRGVNVCQGYYTWQGAECICPCSCHKGESVEDTMRLALQGRIHHSKDGITK